MTHLTQPGGLEQIQQPFQITAFRIGPRQFASTPPDFAQKFIGAAIDILALQQVFIRPIAQRLAGLPSQRIAAIGVLAALIARAVLRLLGRLGVVQIADGGTNGPARPSAR